MNSLCLTRNNPRFSSAATLVVLVSLSGCGRGDVQVYRVAKESPQQATAQHAGMSLASAQPDAASARPALQYKLPAGWEESPPGEMRAAAFRVKGPGGKQADIGVIPMPGLMGRDLETVNRWRAGVGLQAVTEEELPKLAQSVQVAGETGQLYDQAGENPGSGEKTRLLGAIVRHDGIAWFFKMTGDDELITQQKPAFIELLKSVTFPAGMAQSELPPSHPPIGGGMAQLPASHPPIGGNAGGTPGDTAGSAQPALDWPVPAGWKSVPTGSQFLLAKYQLTGTGNAQATVNVSTSNGDGGGLVANVNRWRGQLGLAPLSEAEVTKLTAPLEIPGGKGTLVDMGGAKSRMLAAIVPRGGQTWFFKLMGDEQLVQSQKEAFTKFVASAKY